MSKAGIINDFNILAQLFKKAKKNSAKQLVPGRDPRRQAAYQNAATAVCVLPGDRIISLKIVKKGGKRPNGSRANKREVYATTNTNANVLTRGGLGKATTDKINEYIKTGKIKAAENAREWLAKNKDNLTKDQRALKVFGGVFNVGEATAKEWLKKYKREHSKLTPLEWVRSNKNALPKKVKGVWDDRPLSHAQKVGLKYYDDLQKRIPRHYIDIVQLMIRVVFSRTFGRNSYKMDVAGSYRRGAKDSGDIDIIFTSRKFDLNEAVTALKKWGIIVDDLSGGTNKSKDSKHKFTGICHCPSGQWYYFHLDLVYTTEAAWDAALLWFTGSKGFNLTTRAKAKKLGLILNQYGLFRIDDTTHRNPVALKEKDILAALGMQYIPPECR
jgi:DNA polymerase/3'-5' exonuclease PolX